MFPLGERFLAPMAVLSYHVYLPFLILSVTPSHSGQHGFQVTGPPAPGSVVCDSDICNVGISGLN